MSLFDRVKNLLLFWLEIIVLFIFELESFCHYKSISFIIMRRINGLKVEIQHDL